MKIVYIHFHLKTGGVTTVLTQQANALRRDADILVIAGTPPQSSLPVDAAVIAGVGYNADSAGSHEPETVAAEIAAAVKAKWKTGCDLIHVHNALLAKNKNLLKILGNLQQRKFNLFIQIHDFAEDGRPDVYFEDEYPRNCHYGVINSRDYHVLLRSGLRKEGLHRLTNMIRSREVSPLETVSGQTVLYPVRALRRKNIGEAILLSLFFRKQESLAITLPPNSPIDLRSFQGWKAFVNHAGLPVRFDAGVNADFETLLKSARLIITTSIMEGFGFSYLEPWTIGKYLWGRNLPEICRDFEEKGIRLDHLYSRLQVPLEWIGKEAFVSRQFHSILENSRRFQFPIDTAEIERSVRHIPAGNMIDFGLLDEDFQKKVLNRVISSTADRNRLIELNPFLAEATAVKEKESLIRHNREAVSRHYSEEVYRQNLLGIYRKVVKSPVEQQIDKQVLLSEFFRPESFSLLKWGDYVE